MIYLSKKQVLANKKFSIVETEYVSMVQSGKEEEDSQIKVAHETAQLLYQRHHPIGTVEAGLYLLWFSVFTEMLEAQGCQ